MSGGYFNYDQERCYAMAEVIGDWLDKHGDDEPSEVVDRMRYAMKRLVEAGCMAHRIDWYISGDDGVESFVERWNAAGLP